MKTYKRDLPGMNSIQKLITNNGEFHRIENIPLGAHITIGFCPNEFSVGEKIPRGFFKKFGFKKYKESYNESSFQDYSANHLQQVCIH